MKSPEAPVSEEEEKKEAKGGQQPLEPTVGGGGLEHAPQPLRRPGPDPPSLPPPQTTW